MTISKHVFVFDIPESDIEGVVPRKVTVEVSGDATLPELIEQFVCYLRAAEFIPPDNCHLDWVENE
jgi:hypothetical protein